MLTTVSKSFPRPAHYEILTIELDTTAHIVMLQSENGRLDLECVFIGAISGNALYKRVYHLVGEYTFYAVAARKFPGKFYLVQWAPAQERFGCSCFEGRHYSACQHSVDVEEYTCREVAHV